MQRGIETSEWWVTVVVAAVGVVLLVAGIALLWRFPAYVGLIVLGLGSLLIVSSSRDYVGSRTDAKTGEAARDRPVYAPADSIQIQGRK